MSDESLATASPLQGAIGAIGALDWHFKREAQHDVLSIFEALEVGSLLAELKIDLSGAIDASRSIEKTTHYKWFIANDPERRFEMWLHEYKPKTHRRQGHAAVPHNHRFWLTSLILRGGFTDVRYSRRQTHEPGEEWVESIDSRELRPTDTMVIDPNEIHSLSDLEDDTLSLIVQSRPVRHYSEVFEGGEIRRYSDLEAQLEALASTL